MVPVKSTLFCKVHYVLYSDINNSLVPVSSTDLKNGGEEVGGWGKRGRGSGGRRG